MAAQPTGLHIEHRPRSLGIGFKRPRLSWILPDGASAQEAYEVEARIGDRTLSSSTIVADSPILVPWPFPDLESRCRVAWRVRTRTSFGWSDWSSQDHFETGLLSVDDWRSSFVGYDDGVERPRGGRPALYLRRQFQVDSPLQRGRIYATAQGIYELHLDGRRLGDLELTPGFTAYRTYLEYQTYDVTDLSPGPHTLIATVSDGWWRGAVGFTHQDRSYGEQLALLAQIELTRPDGALTIIGSGSEWEGSLSGPILAADLMEGQQVDLRIPFPPEEGWHPVQHLGAADRRLTVSPAPPTRRVQDYSPVSVTRLDENRQVVDFGANINGWVRLAGRSLGPAGTRVTLRHGERLGPDGDVDTTHLDSFEYFTRETIPVGQIDSVVSAGPRVAEVEPRHTTHGFQYVSAEGANDLSPNDVTGIMVHGDLERTGWFECSDSRLNALHEAAVLSLRGNVCEVPTDCPTRERAGWTGDWQIFVPTAAFLYDVAGFSTRWLRDLAADQWEDGRVPNFVPDPYEPKGREHGVARYLTGSAGWGDAAVYVPYQIWQSYGDVDLLERQYPSMVAWVRFALGRAADHRHHARVADRPTALPHERYLWDIGFHWGEWLEPGSDSGPVLSGQVDVAEIATAYLYRTLRVVAAVAALLDLGADTARYQSLAAEVRDAWRTEFVSPDGSISRPTQANLVRALAFGLLEPEETPAAAALLAATIRAAGTTVGTGFLATPFLLPTLAEHGYVDLAFELLLQTEPPSWLHMIEAGATTIWENWEGLDKDGAGSLNHYSKGAVISFLHHHVAGLRPVAGVPAYRRFEVRPTPGGGISAARADLTTPYGPVGIDWNLEPGRMAAQVRVAPGTDALVTLPGMPTMTLGPGVHRLIAPWP